MTIDELNALPPDEAAAALRTCAAVERWVADLVAARPYADAESLYADAIDRAAEWSDAEVDEALADHPRIGERTSNPQSSREQAAMGRADDALKERMRAGNAAYEDRFGRIYLVRAAGRSAEELLDVLEQRLTHDAETERAETKRQLAEIAVLRLRGLVA
jgi:2-oxo-4-hydroxy-4-carboxy-5-ureidoimidazoline decarboxylase